jgi:hypothetical protein
MMSEVTENDLKSYDQERMQMQGKKKGQQQQYQATQMVNKRS